MKYFIILIFPAFLTNSSKTLASFVYIGFRMNGNRASNESPRRALRFN